MAASSVKDELIDKIKKDVRSVLITESGGMALPHFLKIFRQLTNSAIPYRRMGYQTVEEFLLAATDVCECKHLPSGELHLHPVSDSSTEHILKMVQLSRKPKSSTTARASAGTSQSGTSSRPRTPACLPASARSTILKLVASHPQGIHLDEFNQKHRDVFGHAITYINMGFFSVKGMLMSISHLVRVKETPTGDKVFPLTSPDYDVKRLSPAAGDVALPRSSHSASVSQPPALRFISYEDSVRDLSRNLQTVLAGRGAPVRVTDILELHRRQFGRNLDVAEYGFTSVLSAVVSLGPPFHLSKQADEWLVSLHPGRAAAGPARPTGGGDGPLPGADEAREQLSDARPAGRAPAQNGAPSVGRSGRLRPPPAPGVTHRFTVGSLQWIEDGRQVVTETGYPQLEVVVTNMRTPSDFSFCVPAALSELERLEADMAALYGSAAGCRLQPTDGQLAAGQPLAVRSPSGWRRGLLVGRVAEQAKVHLVDTGATLVLPLYCLQTLHPKFVEPPILCHQGSLANVSPVDGVWSEKAIRLFRSLVADQVVLIATVLRQTEFCSCLLLCDTNGETDLHVGDQLLAAQQAVVPDQLDDAPPASLRTPRPRLLDSLYRLLDEQGGPPPGQGRMPPEGAEPPTPGAASLPAPGPDKEDRRADDVQEKINALKVQCYDVLKESQAAPSVAKRAALRAKVRRLECEMERLKTRAAEGGDGSTPASPQSTA